MPKPSVAVYGPKPKQFQRVLAALPPTVRKTHRFRLGTASDFRVRAAALHVLWGRKVPHQLIERVRTVGGRVQIVQLWNAEKVRHALRVLEDV